MSDEIDGEVPVTPERLPIVDYLKLGDDPHLLANECTTCGARYFDRRNACAKCGAVGFATVRLADRAPLGFALATWVPVGVCSFGYLVEIEFEHRRDWAVRVSLSRGA